MYAAVDCGDVVNTDTATAQVEGGIMFGLAAAWLGEITIADGKVAQSNFHDYQDADPFGSAVGAGRSSSAPMRTSAAWANRRCRRSPRR